MQILFIFGVVFLEL